MRKNLRLILIFSCSFSLTTLIHAQNDRFAFAITDLEQTGAGWNALRRLDLQNGEYSKILLNGTNPSQVVFDATTRKAHVSVPDVLYGNAMKPAFATGVAAMAYDKINKRLYFTPMFIDQLRYIDLKTMKLYYVTDQTFTGHGNMHNDEGKVVTRMVITPGGDGYAITNDAKTFIHFTTGKKLKITQLGSLVDDPENGGSIHNRCSSWGGDMVADDKGNLYIFTARNTVYKVDVSTKVATLQKYITGLPAGFTINGAVVNDNNQVLVSSAAYDKAWYIVDPKTWTATQYKSANGIYRSSDLANSNYLSTGARNYKEIAVVRKAANLPEKVMIYPNPVTNDQFTIQFGKIPAGNYNIELTDVTGRIVMRQEVDISYEDQAETVSLKKASAKGVYLVKVIDKDSKSIFTQKLVVQ